MAGLTDYFDSIAQVIGGTAPDPTNRPRWFSGVDKGDSTGIAGLNGCYSGPQQDIFNLPVGIVLSVRQRMENPLTDTLTMGTELWKADFTAYVLMDPTDWETQFTTLSTFPDLMYTAFRSHVGLFGLANAYQAAVVADDGPKNLKFPLIRSRSDFFGWEFTIRVLRDFTATYTA